MSEAVHVALSRRERQIMDVVYRLGEASAAEVVRNIPDRPTYNSVRVTLSILEKKGVVKHRAEGNRYVYYPTITHENASRSALRHVLRTFFGGSPSRAILALLDESPRRLSKAEMAEIAAAIRNAKEGT
jgi:BlaI family transcriptional regulator, penicillinase repressor